MNDITNKGRMALESNRMALARDLDIGSGHLRLNLAVQIHFLRTSHTFTS